MPIKKRPTYVEPADYFPKDIREKYFPSTKGDVAKVGVKKKTTKKTTTKKSAK